MSTDTHAAFESNFVLSQRQAKKDNAGEYIDEKVRDKWKGWQAAMESAIRPGVCPYCGTHEIDLSRTCHNSRCVAYAEAETIYEGWKHKP